MISDLIKDAGLNTIPANADKVYLCSSEPTTYAEATTTYALGNKTITSGSFTGPADGTGEDRVLTLGALTGFTITASGTAKYYALVKTATSYLIQVGEVNPLTSGYPVIISTPINSAATTTTASEEVPA